MGIHEYPSSRAKEKWRDKSDFYPKCMVKHFIKLSLSLPSIVPVGEVIPFPWPGTQNHILYITPQNHGMEVYRNASKCCYDPVRCCRSVQSFHVHSSEKMSRLPDSKFFHIRQQHAIEQRSSIGSSGSQAERGQNWVYPTLGPKRHSLSHHFSYNNPVFFPHFWTCPFFILFVISVISKYFPLRPHCISPVCLVYSPFWTKGRSGVYPLKYLPLTSSLYLP